VFYIHLDKIHQNCLKVDVFVCVLGRVVFVKGLVPIFNFFFQTGLSRILSQAP
jgi:hypothetical protein